MTAIKNIAQKNTPTTDDFERNTEIALFRYGLIAPLLYEPPETGVTEKALRAIAAKSYTIPHSERTRVSVTRLRRYLQAYREGGFEALRPQERSDKRTPRPFSIDKYTASPLYWSPLPTIAKSSKNPPSAKPSPNSTRANSSEPNESGFGADG